jgi:hypothetical protein
LSVKPTKPLTNSIGEVRELLAADFRAMKSTSVVLPADLLEYIKKVEKHSRSHQTDDDLKEPPNKTKVNS